MSTMQVGFYDLQDFNLAQHSFGIMDGDVRFCCYGGTDGPNRVFPAVFWKPQRGSWDNRGKGPLVCNSYIARGLAEFQIPSDLSRKVYDRKSGGYRNLGDCSGIEYAINGVCHQMCNVITIALDPALWYGGDIDWAPVNWPPSLAWSWLGWSFRGTIFPGGLAEPFLRIVREMYRRLHKLSYNVPAEELPTNDQLPGYFNDLYAAKDKLLKESLETEPQPEARAIQLENLFSGTLGAAADVHGLSASILDADTAFLKVKQDLDNQLIRGQIGHSDFADAVNKAFATMIDRYVNVLNPEDFKKVFGSLPGDKPPALIDPQLMPETYEGVKEALGL